MFRSQDIQVFVFLVIPWFTKSLTSWWVLVQETKHIFEYIHTGAKFQPISILLQLLNNQLCQDSIVSCIWKCEKGTIKNGKHQLLKMSRSCHIVILIKP